MGLLTYQTQAPYLPAALMAGTNTWGNAGPMAERTKGRALESHRSGFEFGLTPPIALVKGFTSLTLSFPNWEKETVIPSPQNCRGFPRYPESSTVPGTGMTSSYKLWLRIIQNSGIT